MGPVFEWCLYTTGSICQADIYVEHPVPRSAAEERGQPRLRTEEISNVFHVHGQVRDATVQRYRAPLCAPMLVPKSG